MEKPFYTQEGDVAIQALAVKTRGWAAYLRQHCTAFLQRENGAIAVEFSLLLPLLVVGLVFLGMLAAAIQRRIDIEQILRAGAEAAVKDPGQTEVQLRMNTVATAKGYALWTGTTTPIPHDQLFLQVSRNCSCPSTLNIISPNCSVQCSDNRPQIVRYTFGATYYSSFDYQFWEILNRLFVASHTNNIFFNKQVLVR